MKVSLKLIPIPRPKKTGLSTNNRKSFSNLRRGSGTPKPGPILRRTENYMFFLLHQRIVFEFKLPGNTRVFLFSPKHFKIEDV